MAVLDVIQQAARRLNIPVPTAAAQSSDPQVRQLTQLVQEELEDAVSRHDWNVLTRSGTFAVTALAGGVAAFTWPTDFKRMRADSRLAIRGNRQRMTGPVSSRDWNDMLDGMAGVTGAFWRPYGLGIQVSGVFVGDVVRFDYVATDLLVNGAGEGRATVSADTDRPILPERLTRLGVIWRWRQAKGLDYAEDLASYERELERVTSADDGLEPISTGGGMDGTDPLSLPSVIAIHA